MKKRLIIMALALGTSAFIFAQDRPVTSPTAPTKKAVAKHTPNAVSDAKTVKADDKGDKAKMDKHTPDAASNAKPNTTKSRENAKMGKKHLPTAKGNDKPTTTDKPTDKGKPEVQAVKKHTADGMQKKMDVDKK